MKFFIVSFVLHFIIIFYVNVFSIDESIEFKKVGDPDVSFTMVEGSSEPVSSNKVEEPVKEKKVEQKKKVIEQPKKKETIQEVEKEVIEVPKEIDEVIEVEEETPEEEVIQEETVEEISEELVGEVVSEVSDISETEAEEVQTETESSDLSSDSFIHLEDGSIVAKNQGVKGLSYGWINDPDPQYPTIARRMKYDKDVIIKVRFLVGYDGKIEEVRFYDNMTGYGFRNEVEKTLKEWEATPVKVDGQKVKLYFYKTFKFEKI